MSIKNVVEVKKTCKEYQMGKMMITALRNVDLSIAKSDFMVIAGPSGSGKTSLLNIIGLIDKPTSGELYFEGENITEESLNVLYRKRRDKIGYIFQTFNLVPVLNVFENVEYPLLLQKISKSERHRRVSDVLAQVGLESRHRHKPSELSGGQRQRVSIARAIVKDPEIVLADEPTANLDSFTGMAIIELMEQLNREQGVTFVFSSHDLKIIEKSHKIVTLKDGEIDQIKNRMN